LNNITFNSDEILVFRNAKDGTQAVTNRFMTVDLDCTLDQDLIDEGLAREIVNRIQKTRKDSNFNVSDRIEVTVHSSKMLANVFKKYQEYIASETLMVKGSVSETSLKGAMVHDIDEVTFEIKAVKA